MVAADGFAVCELHSDLTQPQRNRAMEGFRRGDCQVLVATNLAARGLDVEHITHVISFDVPAVPDDYVHRIGRTARAGAEGDAFLLVSPAEEKALAQIERQIGQRLPRVLLPDFDYAMAAPERAGRAGQRLRGWRPAKPSRTAAAAARNGAAPGSPGSGRSGRGGRARRSRRGRG